MNRQCTRGNKMDDQTEKENAYLWKLRAWKKKWKRKIATNTLFIRLLKYKIIKSYDAKIEAFKKFGRSSEEYQDLSNEWRHANDEFQDAVNARRGLFYSKELERRLLRHKYGKSKDFEGDVMDITVPEKLFRRSFSDW